MSLRIHELAKRINMEGKELLALLKARNWVSADTRSVSSTVSKIYIEEIEKEFAAQIAATAAAAAAADVVANPPAAVVAPEVAAAPPKVSIPSGVFVKSKLDIDREREAAAAVKAAALKAASAPVLTPTPSPAVAAPAVAAPAAVPVTLPASVLSRPS
jgi:translation initiation factor IF-2